MDKRDDTRQEVLFDVHDEPITSFDEFPWTDCGGVLSGDRGERDLLADDLIGLTLNNLPTHPVERIHGL